MDQVARYQTEGSHERGVLRLVPDLAVLGLPADKRLAGLGQAEEVPADLIPR